MHTQTHTQICRKKANDKTNEAKVKQLVILGKKKSIVKFPVLFLNVFSKNKMLHTVRPYPKAIDILLG